jgi:hypothetical protein
VVSFLVFAWEFAVNVNRMNSKIPEIVASCVQNYCHSSYTGVAIMKFYVELNAK